jgi:hypothetical protein
VADHDLALIERARMGCDCLNTGCVPSKAHLASGHAARTARGAGRLGRHLQEPEVDWDAVQAHAALGCRVTLMTHSRIATQAEPELVAVPRAALAGMIVPYPTRAEALKRAAGGFFTPKLFAAGTKRLVRWLARLP